MYVYVCVCSIHQLKISYDDHQQTSCPHKAMLKANCASMSPPPHHLPRPTPLYSAVATLHTYIHTYLCTYVCLYIIAIAALYLVSTQHSGI